MSLPFAPSIIRLRVTPDDAAERPMVRVRRSRGCKRPHADSEVAHVRRLIEQSTLTYSEISAKTGVGRASICRWTRDGGWTRPVFAPRATDTVRSARAGQKLKLRTLAERLRRLAERYIRELEDDASVDVEALMQALQVLKMARCEAQGRRRRRHIVGAPSTRREWLSRDEAIRTALKDMRRGGVDLDRAPQEAMDLLIDANLPPEDHMMLKPPRLRKRRT